MNTIAASHVRHPKTFAEFFAGIGLVHKGLQPNGWQCVYANDNDPKKHQMYAAEFGDSPYYHVESIRSIDAVIGQITDVPFLATASFPCVDLSLAGHCRGLDGEHSSTFFAFIDVLRQLRKPPKIVMLENVVGLISSRGGDDFRRAAKHLADLGYWIDAITLDARYFVPQSRPRVFLFGYHHSVEAGRLLIRRSDTFMADAWMAAVERSGDLRPRKLRSLFDSTDLATGWATVGFDQPVTARYDLSQYLDTDSEQEWWKPEATQRHYEMMQTPSRSRVEEAVRRKQFAVGAAFRRTRQGKTRLEVRFDIAGCLRTPKGGSAKQIVVSVDPTSGVRMRWMTAREYARLQGAGDYTIDVPPIQAMYGFGDAVCVPAITWIDENILTPLYLQQTAATRDTTAA